jgi:ABC-type antimicrobial peptide transport system permease subunit
LPRFGIGIQGLLIVLFQGGLLSPLSKALGEWRLLQLSVATFLVGLVFGLYPAMKAAALQPVDAMRYE